MWVTLIFLTLPCRVVHMNIVERGERFSYLLAQELKKAVKESGTSSRKIAPLIGSQSSQLSLYYTGKRIMPVSIFLSICEVLKSDPKILVSKAYAQLVKECGEYAPDIQPQPVAKVVRPDFRSATTPTVRDDDFPDFSKMAALDPGYDLEAEALAREEYP